MRDLQAEIRAALIDSSLQDALPKATLLAAQHRREATAAYRGYEVARDRARAIKEGAVERLPALVDRLEEAVQEAGGHTHRAVDAEQACSIIAGIALDRGLRRAVKSKSMTSEEIHLNRALEEAGVSVRETDLGEYIVQIANDRPSHIIAPIIHMSLEDVRAVFRTGLGMESVPERAEGLTQLARQLLRSDFLAADLGITGANFLIADSGTVIVVENEGNARLCTQLPAVHVVLAGIEKILPSMADLEPFLQLLPRSATGQLLTSYLSVISGPGWGGSPLVRRDREFHLVLLDNGRTQMREDPLLREALYCIRCGACLNVCAPYQAVGGHVFGGETYQSGIGNAWEAGVHGLDVAAQFNQLCTGCSRCRDVCPVRIDIPWLNSSLRQRIHQADNSSRGVASALLKEPRRLYRLARRTASMRWISSTAPLRWALERLLGIDRRRPLPELAAQTLTQWQAARGEVVLTGAEPAPRPEAAHTVVFWADCHTDHVDVDAGRAAIRVLEQLGNTVLLATRGCCGRAAISQGDMAEARRQARETLRVLEPLIEKGYPVVGLEPSCLSCLVEDHRKLLPDDDGPLLLEVAVREIMLFLDAELEALAKLLAARADALGTRTVVLHGHCQQKSAGWLGATERVLQAVPGVRVRSTVSECCGMAGSFGYKPEGYEVSRELGRRLVSEIAQLSQPDGGETLACGTSCRAQLADFGDRRPRHPVQLVAEALGL